MDPITGSLISSFAAPVIGGLFGLGSNKSSNKAAAASAREANRFTKEMMTSRHQWEVADLKAAGLNPVLSAGGAPSMGHSAQAPVFSAGEDVAKGVSSALASKRLSAEMGVLRAQERKEQSQADLNDVIGAKTIQDRKSTMLENVYRELGLPQAAFNSAWFSSKEGQALESFGKGAKAVNPFLPSTSRSEFEGRTSSVIRKR